MEFRRSTLWDRLRNLLSYTCLSSISQQQHGSFDSSLPALKPHQYIYPQRFIELVFFSVFFNHRHVQNWPFQHIWLALCGMLAIFNTHTTDDAMVLFGLRDQLLLFEHQSSDLAGQILIFCSSTSLSSCKLKHWSTLRFPVVLLFAKRLRSFRAFCSSRIPLETQPGCLCMFLICDGKYCDGTWCLVMALTHFQYPWPVL